MEATEFLLLYGVEAEAHRVADFVDERRTPRVAWALTYRYTEPDGTGHVLTLPAETGRDADPEALPGELLPQIAADASEGEFSFEGWLHDHYDPSAEWGPAQWHGAYLDAAWQYGQTERWFARNERMRLDFHNIVQKTE